MPRLARALAVVAVAATAAALSLAGATAAQATTPTTVTVTGFVTDGYYPEPTLLPDASGLQVTAYYAKGDSGYVTTGAHLDSATGSYSITLPANHDYTLHFVDLNSGNGSNGSDGAVWYGGSVLASGATVLHVGTTNLANVNVTLPLGGQLGGNVSWDSAGGNAHSADLQAFIWDPALNAYDPIAETSITVFVSDTVDDASFTLSGLPTGRYVVRASNPLWDQAISSPVNVTGGSGGGVGGLALAPAAPTTTRYAGSDRFDTAAKAAIANGTTGKPVFIASGVNAADALSGGPAAAKVGGSLLLVPGTSIPSTVQAALTHLAPSHIYVLGGPASISDSVMNSLQHYATTTRVAGADRYATSRAVVSAFWTSARRVFLATGLNFPDALSVGPVAGAQQAPVLLVPGSASSIDSSTTSLLHKLGTSDLRIAGGTASISAAYATSLDALSGVKFVVRYAGADRFETAVKVNDDNVAFSQGIILATGTAFPDALAAAAIGGELGDPIYLVQKRCSPNVNQDPISAANPSEIFIMGGTASVSDGVLTHPCTAAG